MKLRNGKAKLNFELRPEVKKELHTVCVALDISMSSVLERLVGEWLKKMEGRKENAIDLNH